MRHIAILCLFCMAATAVAQEQIDLKKLRTTVRFQKKKNNKQLSDGIEKTEIITLTVNMENRSKAEITGLVVEAIVIGEKADRKKAYDIIERKETKGVNVPAKGKTKVDAIKTEISLKNLTESKTDAKTGEVTTNAKISGSKYAGHAVLVKDGSGKLLQFKANSKSKKIALELKIIDKSMKFDSNGNLK